MSYLTSAILVTAQLLWPPILQATSSAAVPTPKISITATIVSAQARMSGRDCGFGLTTYTGSHSASIISLNAVHENRTWMLRGEMHKCGTIFFSRLSSCDVSGVAQATSTLICTTQRDFPCELEVKAKSVGSMFLVTSDTYTSLCFSRHCETWN